MTRLIRVLAVVDSLAAIVLAEKLSTHSPYWHMATFVIAAAWLAWVAVKARDECAWQQQQATQPTLDYRAVARVAVPGAVRYHRRAANIYGQLGGTA